MVSPMAGENDKLLWLAYRYATDEMSLAEADTFEQQMADDQRAREALAEAVELTFTTQAAFTLPEILAGAKAADDDAANGGTANVDAANVDAANEVRPAADAWSRRNASSRQRNTPVGWIALAAVASLAALVLGAMVWVGAPRDGARMARDTRRDNAQRNSDIQNAQLAAAGELAQLWADWSGEDASEVASDWWGDDVESLESSELSGDDFGGAGSEEGDAEELSVPAWLLAAVFLDAEAMTPNDPTRREN